MSNFETVENLKKYIKNHSLTINEKWLIIALVSLVLVTIFVSLYYLFLLIILNVKRAQKKMRYSNEILKKKQTKKIPISQMIREYNYRKHKRETGEVIIAVLAIIFFIIMTIIIGYLLLK